ncbi:class II aldolase/adducin family protein [Muricomes intestini]|jgi:L-fuculose-phosphate aldolase|uniref:L-fuculose-phosphate aldolase n=2 Tax=Muricomes intestini TaxID=1796634 RepID=A0A4R3KEM9_9FIRM|nr:class II aldolase/adducin family protein [Muricomes intestini]TCS81678.1 L-fuculose-phosphate aldolase [Muricomes intestini]HAX52292.1 class II aldolase family protein [Lachnospiraceae bacterium]HCR82731.1 class II aldolase family protein [Lachnospiraceae bacterium]
MQNEYEIKKQMCEIGKRVYNRGMVAANDGNFSVKLNDNEFLCTPTGVSKGFMTPEYICKVDANGNVLQANKGFKPSSEIKMHMRVYKERPDVNAVVHAHPLYATTFAICGIPLTQPIMPEAVIALGCVPIAKYGTPSTEEIPDAVEEYVQSFDAVLLENHGALTYSNTLLNAYHKMESVEFYARLLYQSRMLGEPQEFNQAQIDRLYEIRRQMGLPGKHPANLCPNAKAGKQSCHSCAGSCGTGKDAAAGSTSDADLVASITKKVMAQLGM